jgi:uncharacterized protein YciI
MPYAIQTIDKPDHGARRAELRAAHLEYLKGHQQKLLAAGALTDDQGQGGSGGILLVDTDDRAEAERFIANDPYTLGGLFASVTVTRWRKAFFDGRCLL